MARKLGDIFNECYERMRTGESLKSCLKRYPEHAAELESLLRTAFDIGRRASYVQPRPEFKHWSRVRFEGAQLHARQRRQAEKPSPFSWRRSWAVALTAILVVLLTGGSTVAAASNALPDQPLYPVKLATEQVRLAFAVSDASKVELHTRLAETKAMEVEAMVLKGKTEHAVIAAERLANQLDQANYAIARVESTEVGAARFMTVPETTAPVPAPTPAQDETMTKKTEQMKESLAESTSKSLTALENALEKAPPQAKPALQRAINIISEKSHGKPQQKPGVEDKDKDKGKKNDDGKTEGESKRKDETNPTPVKSEPSQPSSQSDNNTGNVAQPTPVSPSQSQPASQNNNNTGNVAQPPSTTPNQNQPPSHKPKDNSK